jgi:hypothetical protein
MATAPPYPGVHLREAPSGAQTISGASTSVAAFVGFLPPDKFADGIEVDEANRVFSWAEFQRKYGGLDSNSETSYAVQQFFNNGGSEAWIVAVGASAAPIATLEVPSDGSDPALTISAKRSGAGGEDISVAIYPPEESDGTYTLIVREESGDGETHAAIANADGEVTKAEIDELNDDSSLISVTVGSDPIQEPTGQSGSASSPHEDDFDALSMPTSPPSDAISFPLTSGNISQLTTAIAGDNTNPSAFTALDDIEPATFNILCVPDAYKIGGVEYANDSTSVGTNWGSIYTEASKYIQDKNAFMIVDLPEGLPGGTDALSHAQDWADSARYKNAAIYYPATEIADALDDYARRNVGPSGTMAGLYARIDSARGIWKAPAGTEARMRGASPSIVVGDMRNGKFNESGINVLREFAGYGPVSWGARTLVGTDSGNPDNKYVPVRRMTLFLKQSLLTGLKWAVFEPNAEPLWTTIRQTVRGFMNGLYRQGAFKGETAREAFFVRCDSSTTTPEDINKGIVNVVVGFAPLKPAEFVVVTLKQIAGQA